VRFGQHQTTPAQLLEQIRRPRATSRRPRRASSRATPIARPIVLVADVVGYSRMMSDDPDGALDALKACRRDAFRSRRCSDNRGRIFGEARDSVCAEFREADDALRAAKATLLASRDRRFGRAQKRVAFRIGIHAGEVHGRGQQPLRLGGQHRRASPGPGAAGPDVRPRRWCKDKARRSRCPSPISARRS
jgi:class 3 adenylate cyclase